MKRTIALLLIAILLLCPLFPAQAESTRRIYAPDGLLTAEELADLEARAEEIYAAHGIAPYYFFDLNVTELIPYSEQFVKDHVAETNAIVLGLSAKHYYFTAVGETAKVVFTDSVCDDSIIPSYSAVKNDPAKKILAYLDAVDQAITDAFAFETPTSQTVGKQYLTDSAAFLRSEEADVLLARLCKVSADHQCDIVVLTVSSLNGTDPQIYSDKFFAENGGTDGILLLVSKEDRQYCVNTYGSVIPAFSGDPLNRISDDIRPSLSNGNYMDAFLLFAEDCNDILTGESTGTHAAASGEKQYAVDQMGLLDSSALSALEQRLKSISETYRCDVVAAIVPALGDKTAEEFADDYFDYGGYGYGAEPDSNGMTVNGDGILLLISMQDRDFAISTSGYGITAFTDYGILNYIEPSVLPYLKSNRYGEAFNAYADRCEELLQMARDGRPFDLNRVYTPDGTLTEAQALQANENIAQLYDKHDVAMYFVYDPSASDLSAVVDRLIGEKRIQEPNAVVFCANKNGSDFRLIGSTAESKFPEKERNAILKEVKPYLESGDCYGAVQAYVSRGETALRKHPLNGIFVILALTAGGLFAFIPVGSMKRQLTDVHQNLNADTYLTPASFVMTQNSDVLLGTNTSRSVHVVQSSSGSGRAGGGGSFHSGSSTHTSSSGGTHGGHSGKF